MHHKLRGCHVKVGNNIPLRHHKFQVIILHLLYIDRTDTIYQFSQRRLLSNPNHDQTIRRNAFVLHARQRGKQKCAEGQPEPGHEPQCARITIEPSCAAREIPVEEGTDPGMNEE